VSQLVEGHPLISDSFGFITYDDIESATRAIEARNQDILQGRRITVQYNRPRPSALTAPREPAKPGRTLFIGNMSFEMSDKDLNDLFRDIRNVLDVRVAIDRRSGQPRGFAHADFVDEPSATRAMKVLRDKEVYGRKLRVDYSASHATRKDG
jgi:nucleolin